MPVRTMPGPHDAGQGVGLVGPQATAAARRGRAAGFVGRLSRLLLGPRPLTAGTGPAGPTPARRAAARRSDPTCS